MMKRMFFCLLAACMGAGIVPAFAQVSTRGTDFYVAFGRNMTEFAVFSSYVFQIRIAATQAADVTLTFNADGTVVDNIHVDAGEVYTCNLSAAEKAKVYCSAQARAAIPCTFIPPLRSPPTPSTR